ncbi:endonuclease domain-containing protein [Chryseobacterium taklimakanense]|uniref:endonuclease domain-containing protein n=1 Tax=Chryseobacterium taklimakanense TaxID=536441 RepID=UPI00215B8F31|nr:endonuclease domain-containing protein [Chryseobacterium taklimakanense]
MKIYPIIPNLKNSFREKERQEFFRKFFFGSKSETASFIVLILTDRIIGNYIVEFYVKTLGLVIEIDGTSHNLKEDYDLARQEFLENLGLRVFPITDFDIKIDLSVVMRDLEDFIVQKFLYKPSHLRHPSKGGKCPA